MPVFILRLIVGTGTSGGGFAAMSATFSPTGTTLAVLDMVFAGS